jgi:transposase
MRIDFPNIKDLDYQKLLRSLGYLYHIKDNIEVDLFQAQKNLFNLKVDIIFYDVTSTYFEGSGPTYALNGYSRDRRPECPQILLALAVTQEGLPIGHETYAGNISDKTTVISLIEKLKGRFDIKRCIFVGDRGMVSLQNIAYLKEHGYEYIFAFREVKYLEYPPEDEGSCYIVCHNEQMAIVERVKVDERIEKVRERIQEVLDEYKQPDTILKYVARIYLVDRFFKYGIQQGQFFYCLKQESVEFEKLIAGKYILKTENKTLTAPEIIQAYKNLMLVESSFKDIKGFIDIQPTYHRYEPYVKGHVFICVLAYLLQRVLERYLAQPNELRITARRLLDALSEVKVVENELNGHLIGTITEQTKKVGAILKRLQMPSFGKTTLLYRKTVKLPSITLRKLTH